MPRGAFCPKLRSANAALSGTALARRLRSTRSMRTSPRLLTSYGDFAADLVAEGILSDPWVDGAPRFRMTPIAIDRATQRELYSAAEGVASVHAEAASLCARDPALVTRFFDLPPSYELMWGMSAPDWHGIARADVFLTAAGPQVCELNSDTPSGEPEAVALNRVVDGAGASGFDDPNCRLGDRVFAMVRAFLPIGHPLTVGIIYPTEMTDESLGDLPLRAMVRVAWRPRRPRVAVQPAPGRTWRRRPVRGLLLGHLAALQDRTGGASGARSGARSRPTPTQRRSRSPLSYSRAQLRAGAARGGEPVRRRVDTEQADDGAALGGD